MKQVGKWVPVLFAGVFASAITLLTIGAHAEVGMPGRFAVTPETPRQLLRSLTAPVHDVSIAPTAQQLAAAAATAEFGEGLPPLAKILGLKPPRKPAAPMRVGAVFSANHADTVAQWERQLDGSYVTQLRVSSAGAKGIRAKLQLPTGVTLGALRVAARHGEPAESIPLHVAENGEVWTPHTDGDVQLVEIQTPQRVPGSTLRVLDIVHFEQSLSDAGGPGVPSTPAQTIGLAGSCSPDVACTSGDTVLDAAISQLSKSIARINFVSDGSSFICTGTLINSISQQNYFLTANHCISTQAEASSIETRWFYAYTSCTLPRLVASQTVGGGAQLVFTNQFVDSTLLKLNLSPPTGARFAGWDSDEMVVDTPVVSVSHPRGDLMKYATGRMSEPGNSNGLIRVSGFEQDMYGITLTRGVIEGGSSGSGIFTLSAGELRLRGVLSNSTLDANGNSMSCSNTAVTANYGRYSYFQPQIAPLLAGSPLLVDDHPNQPSVNATSVPLDGAPIRANFEYVGDLDVFKINIAQPGTLYVKSTGGYDLIGNLMDSNGSTLDTNDDAAIGGNDFGISRQVSPGTYYVAVAPWIPTALPPNGYSVSANFTTAITNYTSLWWAGDAESGWGVNVNHQGNVIFATMFNYENAGLGVQNPGMWLVATLRQVGNGQSYSGDLLRATGPAFNALPFTPLTAANATRVGNMRFDFTGSNSGTLTYDVLGAGTGGNGNTIVKSITRQTFAALPSCEFAGSDRSFATNLQDLWWNPNESGWGINFTHQADIIFATLFTYEPGAGNFNKGMWLTATMPKQSTGIYQGDLARVTGSAFNAVPFTPLNPAVNASRAGNMRVQFTNGNAATLTYDVSGQQVTKTIERQVFDPFRTECKKPS